MRWWPYHRETLVLNRPTEAVWLALKMETLETARPHQPGRDQPILHSFNGHIGPNRFRISRMLRSPQTFLPLVKGTIEETSTGCLIFIQYRLFLSTLAFLIFWMSVSFLLGIFFLLIQTKLIYILLAFGLGIANYLVCVKNFQLQLRQTRELLIPLLTGEKPARNTRPS